MELQGEIWSVYLRMADHVLYYESISVTVAFNL